MRVNKWLDFLDRVGWTSVQAAAGAVIVILTENNLGWEAGLKFVGVAVAVAVCKVVIAQRVGNDELGAAIPGKVIES